MSSNRLITAVSSSLKIRLSLMFGGLVFAAFLILALSGGMYSRRVISSIQSAP